MLGRFHSRSPQVIVFGDNEKNSLLKSSHSNFQKRQANILINNVYVISANKSNCPFALPTQSTIIISNRNNNFICIFLPSWATQVYELSENIRPSDFIVLSFELIQQNVIKIFLEIKWDKIVFPVFPPPNYNKISEIFSSCLPAIVCVKLLINFGHIFRYNS